MQHTNRARARKTLAAATAIATVASVGTTAATAKTNHIAVSVSNQHVKAGHSTAITGTLARKTHRKIRLQYKPAGKHHHWKTLKSIRARHSNFRVQAQFRKSGYVRILIGRRTHSQNVQILVLKRAVASWYGPGLYGNRMACGKRLTRKIVAIAHRTLPCGTHVLLVRGSHSVVATVEDRGPFVSGRDIDLTYAAKKRLKFGSVGTVWMRRR